MRRVWECFFAVCAVMYTQVFITTCIGYRRQNWILKQRERVDLRKIASYNNNSLQHSGLVFVPAKYRACACGLSDSRKVRGKVVGGHEADVLAYPWVAHLTHNQGHLLCGGTLITDRHIMTAAHCMRDLTVDKFHVTVGDHDRTVLYESPSVCVRPARITIHPKYERSTFDNDIAIITLCRSVITRFIRPACLLAPLADFTGHPTVVAGWGVTGSFSSLSDTLQQVDIQVVSREMCLNMPLEPFETLVLTDSMICAGVPEGGKDACQGDSGGPLMWNYAGRWYVIGIVSKGFGCAQPGKFGIYTKVYNFLSWIFYITSDGLQCIR